MGNMEGQKSICSKQEVGASGATTASKQSTQTCKACPEAVDEMAC